MSPEQHIEQAETLVSSIVEYTDAFAANARATMALVHVELAKWKNDHAYDSWGL